MTRDHLDAPAVAVVGAGMAGLSCARALDAAGCPVTVVEKARGPGGRMSTRRVDALAFDHGAQYFTVRGERFRTAVEGWIGAGLVAEWQGRIVAVPAREEPSRGDKTRRYVGTPGMSSITRHLANGLNLRTGWRVGDTDRRRDGWWLIGEGGEALGPYAVLVIAVPAPQTLAFLSESSRLRDRVARVRTAACWATMLGFRERVPLEFDGAFVNDGPLAWMARNNSKPGRPPTEAWVLHGSPDWSESHLEDPVEEVIEEMFRAFVDLCATAPASPHLKLAHRWRYALPREPLNETFLFDADLSIGVCGDWCGGPRVEGAYLSGRSLGEHIGGIVGGGSGYP